MRRSNNAAMALVGVSLVAAILAGLGAEDAASDGADVSCPTFGAATRLGVTDGELGLVEASGVVASRRNPGVLWTHNDNAGKNELFALDVKGNVLAKFWLKGIDPDSFEDISFGPGRDGAEAIYLGDIGDNRDRRDEVSFVRVPEPEVDLSWRSKERPVAASSIDTFRVAYRRPGSGTTWGRDAEAFVVDPRSGDLYVFEKKFSHIDGSSRQSYVYEVRADQLVPGRLAVAEPVTHVTGRVGTDGSSFTAADVSRDGSWIIAKNMFETFLWPRAAGESVGEALDRHETGPCVAPAEPGEAVGFLGDGSGFVMLREGPRTPVWHVSMLDATTPAVPPTTAPPAPTTVPPPTTTVPPPTTTTTPIDVEVVGARVPTCRGVPATIVGTKGDDHLVGTQGDDVIVGLAGDDRIGGLGGNDLICGSSGRDTINGGAGDDRLFGGSGGDEIRGGSGNDLIRGHGGADVVDGGAGIDVVAGNAGADTVIDRGPEGLLVGGAAEDECRLGSPGLRVRSCETIIDEG